MRKRNWKLLALAALVPAGVVAFLLLQPVWWQRFTREDFRRVRVGMTLDEVVAILGLPGDYRTGEVTYSPDADPDPQPRPADDDLPTETQTVYWCGDDGIGAVTTDPAGRVIGTAWRPGVPVKASPLDNLLWRARRLGQHWFPES